MVKHPFFVPSLIGTTILSSSTDGTKDVYKWKNHPFFDYYSKLESLLNVKFSKLRNVSFHMKPIELHMQSLCELLNKQKKHYKDPLNCERAIPTKSQYLKSFGLDLSLSLEELFDESETSLNSNEQPNHWSSVLPARFIERNYELDSKFDRLVHKSFALLKKHWVEKGYMDEDGNLLDEPIYKFNLVSKNTLGTNVGAKSAPYLLLGVKRRFGFFKRHENKEEVFLTEDLSSKDDSSISDPYDISYIPDQIPSTESLYSINQSLVTHGVAVVRKVFTREQIKQIKKMLHIKTTLARETAFKILEVDPNVSAMKYSRGRIHCILRGTSFNELISPLQAFWMPIVYYNMKTNRYNLRMLMQTHLDTLSYAEPWHRSNRRFGLNVVVPLDDIDVNGGRIQFLTGTQGDSNKNFAYEIGPSGVDLEVGDILIYNSSILHRNTINETNVCRSMLIFTYDHTDTPPPGQGTTRSIFDKFYGNFVVGINKMFY
ncbi:conserved hypothetical protein [Theileria equi strain WA]|uniref:Uncharacterized protein n=1 Tax=Theileria equi strain WA TaxID=1537102 RepID=L1LF81_THEEQ|nr:conserved hypothetical protein [Theileria equi strain WA]EKX74097.1 conserved hypothetical protein [Theileria equi strain WA]|eukprot:XP_004833549.1 conserved hypothetical protein [Theileria equi strain WA]